MPVRGAIATLINLTPLASKFPNWRPIIDRVGYTLDKIFGKLKTSQVSGHGVFLIK